MRVLQEEGKLLEKCPATSKRICYTYLYLMNVWILSMAGLSVTKVVCHMMVLELQRAVEGGVCICGCVFDWVWDYSLTNYLVKCRSLHLKHSNATIPINKHYSNQKAESESAAWNPLFQLSCKQRSSRTDEFVPFLSAEHLKCGYLYFVIFCKREKDSSPLSCSQR